MKFSHSLLALITAFIWGTNFVVIRYALDFLPPLWLAFWRFFFVAFPLVFFLKPPKASQYLVFLSGIAISIGQFGLLFIAMENDISPGLASLIIQMQVFFTPLLAFLLWGEHINKGQKIGLFMGLLGLGLVASQVSDDFTILGLILVLCAALGWTIGNVTIKKIGPTNMLSLLAWSSLYSLPFVALLAWLRHGFIPLNALTATPPEALLAVLWQSVGNTLIGYGIWNTLLGRYNSIQVTPWALCVPIFGLGASVIAYGESLYWWKITAAILVIGGIAACNMRILNKKAAISTTISN